VCSSTVDSVSCRVSPYTCPNNGQSIVRIMGLFQLSPSAPSNRSVVSKGLENVDLEMDADDYENIMATIDAPAILPAPVMHDSVIALFKAAEEEQLCGICPRNILGECYDCDLAHLIGSNEYGTTAKHAAKWTWRASIHCKAVANIVKNVMLHLG
jgi:hypothetical protein